MTVYEEPISYASADGTNTIRALLWTAGPSMQASGAAAQGTGAGATHDESAGTGATHDSVVQGMSAQRSGAQSPSATRSQPKGIIQIIHGAAEHIERYRDFAAFLVASGYVVCAADHIGHGASVGFSDDLSHIPIKGGADILISDQRSLHQLIAKRYPGLPYIMLGHSMGSFILRNYLAKYGHADEVRSNAAVTGSGPISDAQAATAAATADHLTNSTQTASAAVSSPNSTQDASTQAQTPTPVAAAIIVGTGQQPPLLSYSGIVIARILAALRGQNHYSKWLDSLGMGAYSSATPNARTKFDWLCSNSAVVDAYIADPLCGVPFSVGVYNALATLTARMSHNAGVLPKTLPMLFLAGAEDPVGEKGEGVKRAFKCYQDVGMTALTLHIYEGMRHEVLNETERQKVWQDIVDWLLPL